MTSYCQTEAIFNSSQDHSTYSQLNSLSHNLSPFWRLNWIDLSCVLAFLSLLCLIIIIVFTLPQPCSKKHLKNLMNVSFLLQLLDSGRLWESPGDWGGRIRCHGRITASVYGAYGRLKAFDWWYKSSPRPRTSRSARVWPRFTLQTASEAKGEREIRSIKPPSSFREYRELLTSQVNPWLNTAGVYGLKNVDAIEWEGKMSSIHRLSRTRV